MKSLATQITSSLLNQTDVPAVGPSYRGYGKRPVDHSAKAQLKRRENQVGQKDPSLIAVAAPVSGPVLLSLPGSAVVERRFAHQGLTDTEWDRLWLLMHHLLERFVSHAETFEDYTPVSSRALEALMGREAYTWAKERLREARVIEVDEASIRFGFAGSKSSGWRFHPSIAELPIETRPLSLPASKRFMLKRWRHAVKAANHSPEAALLLANLDRLTLAPQYTEGMPDFEGMAAALTDRKGRRRKMGKKDKKELFALRRRQAAWLLAVTFPATKRAPHFKQSEKTGRIYNSFTSFPKILRGYALLDGQRTVEIDIKNSQPLLLAGFYPPGSKEGAEYKALVEGGTLYEHLMKVGGIALTGEARDKFKTGIYSQVFFGENKEHYEILQVWWKAFPELGQIIWDYKKPPAGIPATVEARKEASKRLAVELQRREAAIMIKAVIRRLSQLLPGVPFLTVHDSLVIPEQHAEVARGVIAEEVRAATGLKPSLRITASLVRY